MAKPHDLFDLSGHVACVTGASSGLGQTAATMLAEAGAKVVGIARRAERLEAWKASTQGETAVLAADLGDRSAVEGIARDAASPFGPPDILVNAAGINTRQAADEVTAEGWDQTIHLNLTVPFLLAQALAPAMKAKGWGRIVNFASLQSRRAFPGGIAYGASKGGVEQLTRAMAEAWSRHGINANALAPGFFPTELTGPVFSDPELAEKNARQTCIGRNGEMADLRGPLLFLSSDASAYVTGQILFVDGGFTAR
ncbi:SDR family NAD(P)-dependent oxidoreductase [Jiella marina]|uniref:SDR family NAD(P)-dependent oxidoreductase n=1 Tax=Jiella sp. LLJ827 TaxID=2917712 RepID=UPI0021009D39|nr:SDR family oxidoreductase [Jiella sp. LLJ827]MCQ0988728.1 SDR family oxidoreductase [Jiella sp. LLJ827]